jgi:hypothetical protein
MKLTHRFARPTPETRPTPEKRPQDPNIDRTRLRFETMETGSFGGTPSRRQCAAARLQPVCCSFPYSFSYSLRSWRLSPT